MNICKQYIDRLEVITVQLLHNLWCHPAKQQKKILVNDMATVFWATILNVN